VFAFAGLALIFPGGDSCATTTVNCSKLQETFIASTTSTSFNSSGTCGYIAVAASGSNTSNALVQFSLPALGGREVVSAVTLGLGTLQTLPNGSTLNPFLTCNGAGHPVGIAANYNVAPITIGKASPFTARAAP